ncbi:MAG TPA: rhomboid family intramembrane serine protease [Verrucomicrobiae bacterium]
MRLIGSIEGEREAALFSDYLFVRGIENQVEREGNKFEVWVLADEQMVEAANLLQNFKANPAAPEYAKAPEAARKKQAQREEEEAAAADRTFSSREVLTRERSTPVVITALLIAISICVALLSSFGDNRAAIQGWYIAQFMSGPEEYYLPKGMPEVMQGEVWRVFTPMFIHYGVVHLFFNMYWLFYLGGMIERAKGHVYFGILVLVSAALSNMAQYYIAIPGFSQGLPSFGGMSGVNYALFGFCWMKSKYDFASGIALHPSTVATMLIWFAICFTGILPIANMAHTIGLVVGVIWGVASARHSLRR